MLLKLKKKLLNNIYSDILKSIISKQIILSDDLDDLDDEEISKLNDDSAYQKNIANYNILVHVFRELKIEPNYLFFLRLIDEYGNAYIQKTKFAYLIKEGLNKKVNETGTKIKEEQNKIEKILNPSSSTPTPSTVPAQLNPGTSTPATTSSEKDTGNIIISKYNYKVNIPNTVSDKDKKTINTSVEEINTLLEKLDYYKNKRKELPNIYKKFEDKCEKAKDEMIAYMQKANVEVRDTNDSTKISKVSDDVINSFFQQLNYFFDKDYSGSYSPRTELSNKLRSAGLRDEQIDSELTKNATKAVNQGMISYAACLKQIKSGRGLEQVEGTKYDWIGLGFIKLLHETRPTSRIDAVGREDMLTEYYNILHQLYPKKMINRDYFDRKVKYYQKEIDIINRKADSPGKALWKKAKNTNTARDIKKIWNDMFKI